MQYSLLGERVVIMRDLVSMVTDRVCSMQLTSLLLQTERSLDGEGIDEKLVMIQPFLITHYIYLLTMAA